MSAGDGSNAGQGSSGQGTNGQGANPGRDTAGDTVGAWRPEVLPHHRSASGSGSGVVAAGALRAANPASDPGTTIEPGVARPVVPPGGAATGPVGASGASTVKSSAEQTAAEAPAALDLSVGATLGAATSATNNRTADVAAAAPVPAPRSVDQLLSGVIDRLRAIPTANGQGLESRLHHPDLGVIRLVVAGRIGETVHAELIAADRHTAETLARALDRSATARSLSGIDLQVRDGSADTSSGRDRTGSAWQREGRPGGADVGPDAFGSQTPGSGRESTQRDGDTTTRRSAADERPPTVVATTTSSLQTGRSRAGRSGTGPAVDVRA